MDATGRVRSSACYYCGERTERPHVVWLALEWAKNPAQAKRAHSDCLRRFVASMPVQRG